VSDIFVDSWGAGTPVVLVHGSLATGAEEWEAQRPLADEGFRLLVLDRRGYGRSPAVQGEDFLRDADDIADLMGNGAHLVGHFPKLVVSGGHSAGFEAICDDLAARIGASRTVVEGAGHEIQFTGPPINEALLALWRTASPHSAGPSSALV
jgi:pimeloyl-ACP methyl ester carboxylesterase